MKTKNVGKGEGIFRLIKVWSGVGPRQPLDITNERLRKAAYFGLRTAFLALKSLL